MGKTYCFFSAQYLPTVGGVERYTHNLANEVIKKGHKAIVVTSALPSLPQHETDENGIEIFRLPAFLFMNGRFPVPKFGKLFFAQMKEVFKRKIDFCLINTYFYPLCIYASYAAKKYKIPSIVVNHGSAFLMTGNAVIATMGKIYEHIAARIVAKNCKNIYGVSLAACQWMQTFNIKTDKVLSNAIDPLEVQTAAKTAKVSWHNKLNLAKDAQIICFAGRIIPEKGVTELKKAMEIINARVPNAVLVFAGDGALLPKLKNENSSNVFFVGKQSYADTLALFAQSSVFCLPTRSEGFACTVLEAAALNCPVITTATGGSPQLLKDESYGILLKDAQPQTIAKACIFALNDIKWHRTAAEKTYNELVKCYTWVKVSQQLLDLSDEVGE